MSGLCSAADLESESAIFAELQRQIFFRLPPSNDLHQQQGGMSARDFAALHGLTKQQLAKLLNAGKVLGASRHPLSKHWWIFPPAKLLETPQAFQRFYRGSGGRPS